MKYVQNCPNDLWNVISIGADIFSILMTMRIMSRSSENVRKQLTDFTFGKAIIRNGSHVINIFTLDDNDLRTQRSRIEHIRNLRLLNL